MSFAKTIASVAVLGLLAAPVAAQANKFETARIGAPVAGSDQMGGDSSLLILLGVVAALGALIIIVDGDDDEPVSP